LSKSKGFSGTSVGRYSLALYELAEESNAIHEIEKDSLSIIQLISNSEDFNSLIKDPTNKKEDQLNVILKISEKFKINNLLTKFLSFLISKRRFFYVEKILKDFIETCSKKRGEIKAELTAAKELTEKEINSIKEELTKNFSSKIKLNYKYDPSLIGGLIVQVGSTMVDTSIKNKLQKITNRMIEA
jgi:F-type H+-transporting ATPase subunit delta